MRFVAPVREAVDPTVFARPPLSQWREFGVLDTAAWPSVDTLNALAENPRGSTLAGIPRFVAQTPELLADGLHYEQRIAERGQIATRERNWHDLLNALIWVRFPALKAALNERQVEEIAQVGTRQRSRVQCALTHFDEAGVIVLLQDPALLPLWDAHDWHGLFWRERNAWHDGRIQAIVFGHALLEHALKPGQLLVGKALGVVVGKNAKVEEAAIRRVVRGIRSGDLLNDPQDQRPLPLSGIPGWESGNDNESFYREAPCFRPLRAGRRYPDLVRAG
ncbi:MAG: DUF3025 domain-containing protein [Rudaea sp.]|nr:DUF3025 domain-containing protein [Rudaea sp.]